MSADTTSRYIRWDVCAMVDAMAMSAEQIRAGLRDRTLAFCLPAAHENFTSDFLEKFSARILKQHWHHVASRTHLKMPALVDNTESEEELAAAIRFEYGADVTDLPGLPLWEVIRRCARARKSPPSR